MEIHVVQEEMMDLPRISIAVVTYKRTDIALRTIESTCKNLIYPKELRSWYIGDDGTPKDDFTKLLNKLQDGGESMLGHHNERLRNMGEENTYWTGKGWNRALGISHQASEFVLWLEDDWELEQPFDLAPYVKLLRDREDVGLVSFRILSVGNEVLTTGHDGIHYLEYLQTKQYSYSGNPHLRHGRFVRHYDWFAENETPGGIELKQDDKYRLDTGDGPKIWRPVSIDPWGVWHHIGKEKSWVG
jgi:GT2 family glycosyltransferase